MGVNDRQRYPLKHDFQGERGELSLEDCLTKLKEIIRELSPNAFINLHNELIIEPKNNIYFRLEDINGELDLQCKVIAWLSRPSCKGVSPYWQKRFLSIINRFLGTQFTTEEIEIVYTYLGNDINRGLCEQFVQSGYDLSLIDKHGLSK
jgi:hypothetical protein